MDRKKLKRVIILLEEIQNTRHLTDAEAKALRSAKGLLIDVLEGVCS